MAVRWKAGQRRKRWTEQAVSLPANVLILLQEATVSVDFSSDASFSTFAKQLLSFGELPSTFAQIAATKGLSDALLFVLKSDYVSAQTALLLYAELLFLHNSRPLHRGLLTPLARLSKDWETKIANALKRCCLEYGQDGIKHQRFSVVGVASSISNLPQPGILRGVLEICLNIFSLSACYDVAWVLDYSNEGGRPPPNTMEDTQDAVGSLYYVLQHYPQWFTNPNSNSSFCSDGVTFIGTPGDIGISNGKFAESAEGRNIQLWSGSGQAVYGLVVRTLVDVLQTSALSRDCVVAAGVGLCAAALFQNSQEEVALLLAKSVFADSAVQSCALLSIADGVSEGPSTFGMLGSAIRDKYQSSFPAEVSKFSEFGKLCVLRGLLTALPRVALNIPLLTRGSNSSAESNSGNEGGSTAEPAWRLWTILYDGILPALCTLSEGPVDSHFKFHTVTALQICLQQVRASVTGKLTQEALGRLAEAATAHKVLISGYEPLPSTMISRILQIVWNNWEDPLTQTVKQVQAIFDLLVDVQFVFAQQKGFDDSVNVEVSDGEFVKQIASNLLAEGRYRKGKYVPLASLALRIGAQKMLSMNPNLLFDTFHAQSDDDVCCSASSFLKAFLERLKADCWSSFGGVMEGDVAFRRLWIPPLLTVLLSGNSRLRTNLNTYALPVAMRIDPDSVVPVLAFILDGASELGGSSNLNWEYLRGAPGLPSHLTMHQRVAAVISVLKVARSLALIDGDIEQEFNSTRVSNGVLTSSLSEAVVVRIQNEIVQVPLSWLEQALTHLDDSLRVDAAELICLNPKTASMPSSLELKMLKLSIPLNMRCSSTSFRMRWTSLLRKFFSRVRTAAWRQHRLENEPEPEPVKISSSAIGYGDDKKKKRVAAVEKQKKGSIKQLPNGQEIDEQFSRDGVSIAEMQEFMQLLSQYLLSSLYPSAPYERKNMAMELLNAIIEVWSLSPQTKPLENVSLVAEGFSPYQAGLLSAEATLVIVGAIVDSWDKLRESAFRILVRYPTPLPGLESTTSIDHILHWAKGLVSSPRVRESDAGALVLRLIFRKYVLDLGWSVNVHTVKTSTDVSKESGEIRPDRVGVAVAEYVESLNGWLEWGIDEGDKDLVKACSRSFVHGVLLTLRYTMEELPWTSVAVQAGAHRLRIALHKLLSLLLRVTTLTLWVVAADALNLPPDMTSDSQAGILDDIMDVNLDEEDFEDEGVVAPVEQMIMVGCWLSMKEVSLLLGTIAREVPLPGNVEGDSAISLRAEQSNSELLNAEQLEAMGAHFLQVLLAMKHNGAIDKTRTGFIALCDRLLRSPDPRLNKLPESWMNQLLERTGAKGQTVDNLLRRSAGIPAAFLALFLAEPDGAPKKLLPMAMKWLIDTSRSFVFASTKDNSGQSSHVDDLVHVVDNTVDNAEMQTRMNQRDEGVVPTVHAFNAMRVAFHDTNLATDTSGFCADGLITAIQAFSCPYWEVRNSATLAFAALVHRCIGFLNVYKRESARRAITGFEFFHRFPTLHPFLLQELSSATLQLQHEEGSGGYQGHGMTSTLHPSLGPVLIILSRLKPSVISSGVGDWLSPSAFRPYVTSCATLENFHVRVLSSRALAPLVSSDELPAVLLKLAERLPAARDAAINPLSSSAIHGVLLQMTVLLNSNCSVLPDLDKRQMILTKLYSEVELRLWLGSIRLCPCHMVVGAFFSMLEALLGIAKTCAQGLTSMETFSRNLRGHLLHLCSECLEDKLEGAASWKESMQVLVRERAANLYFTTILSNWSPLSSDGSTMEHNGDGPSDMMAAQELGLMFSRALTHGMYEVRLATLKVLKKFSLCLTKPTSKEAGWICSYLQPLLVERLSAETHPECVRRILHVFFAWRSVFQRRSSAPEDSSIAWDSASLKIWDMVLHIYRTSRHTKTKEVAMKCMGACLSQMIGWLADGVTHSSSMAGARPERVRSAVNEWICLVKKHSASSESANFRRATALAIVASNLLEQVPWVASKLASKEAGLVLGFAEWYGRSLLQVWCVCVRLLEDEDPELRQSLALSLLDVLALSSGTNGNAHFNAAVPAQVERVVQLAFQCLSSHFGSWQVYWEVLAEWVLGSEDIDALLVNDVDLVRRLFDKEIDNHHEEELVFVQLCCLHLRQLMKCESSCEEFVGVWRRRFLEQAKSCAELTIRMQEKMPWVGGVTNHQDAFKMVYRRLLGLLTFAGPCISSQTQALKDQLLDISGLLQQLPLNPLVSNVMLKVLQAYETRAAIDLGSAAYRVSMGLAFCDEFEPLFLVE